MIYWQETSGHKSVQYAVGTHPSQEAGINSTLRNRARLAADYVVWRISPGGIYTQDDFNTWRTTSANHPAVERGSVRMSLFLNQLTSYC